MYEFPSFARTNWCSFKNHGHEDNQRSRFQKSVSCPSLLQPPSLTPDRFRGYNLESSTLTLMEIFTVAKCHMNSAVLSFELWPDNDFNLIHEECQGHLAELSTIKQMFTEFSCQEYSNEYNIFISYDHSLKGL